MISDHQLAYRIVYRQAAALLSDLCMDTLSTEDLSINLGGYPNLRHHTHLVMISSLPRSMENREASRII